MRKRVDAQHRVRVAHQGEETAGGQAGRGDVEDVDLRAEASAWNEMRTELVQAVSRL